MTLQALLGVELPIIQAPMAGFQGSALAVAVCNAGGLGSLPAIAPLRARAESLGSGEFSPLWAGQNARGRKEMPAAQLTRELAALV
jgi:NAD(P)H-dependent flavin oxidoreductase YrpB (nitropropane dioxygenase family)